MGDLVIGLAKTVVEGVITSVQSAIDEDAKLRLRSHRDLVFMTGEFEMMQSFLNAATTDEQRAKDKVVMTWVRQIRELASDMEDYIDLAVHMDNRSFWWWRLLPTFMAPPLALDMVVEELGVLKARVDDVSKRSTRYNLITDPASQTIVQQQSAPQAAAAGTAEFIKHIEARHAASRQLGLEDLSQLITINEEDVALEVISVWGTCGDFGMTTLMREAYNDPTLRQKFACRAWVKLIHPFNPRDFIRCLMAQFYAASFQGQEDANIAMSVLKKMESQQDDSLLEDLFNVFNKKFLVVLEDLSTMEIWDTIRTFLPDRRTGSRIITSTQLCETATLCVGPANQVLCLKKFSPDHSAYAFFQESSQGTKPWIRGVSPGPSSNDKIYSPEKDAQEWMNKFKLVGRESEMRVLDKYAQTETLHVLSVWGMAGVGKSALVRNLYYGMVLDKEAPFKMFKWVDVSHPFELKDLCRSLHLDKEECRRLMGNYRGLIVIDDLQSEEEWDFIRPTLVPASSRSLIIVVTAEESIATYCADGEGQVFNVKGLEADAAFELFTKEVKQKNPIPSSFSRREAAELRELILKCGGIPKIIVAISGLLTTKTDTWMETASSINDKFMDHLENKKEFDSLRGIFDRMHSILRSSPDFLKPYIFYLSIFPRDHSIRRRRLIRRWIAEGYSRDGNDKHAEENAEIFFSKLLDMSIIHQPPQLAGTTAFTDTRMVFCQVDGFYREYIISRRMEENLVSELRATFTATTQRIGRHLIIRENWDRDINVYMIMDFSRLRSMTVFGKWESFFIRVGLKMLRVLDLEDASGVTDAHVEQIVKLLLRLEFLSLRGCGEVFHLPSFIQRCRYLETLDVRHTSILALPPNIVKLNMLQYIRAGSIVQDDETSTPHVSVSRPRRQLIGVRVPRGIGKLVRLRTLGVVNIAASAGGILKELKKLNQLYKLGVSGINTKNSLKFFSAISDHAHLESLSVQLDRDSRGCLDGIPLPLDNLRSLKLYGLEDKLPKWSDRLRKLVKLDLEMDTLRKDDMRFFAEKDDMSLLGELPNLCTLRLRVKQLADGKLHFCVIINGVEQSSYAKVKILEIVCSSKLHVAFGAKTMEKLEVLKVDCCSGSSVHFAGLEGLLELKSVLLKGSHDETLKQDLQSQLDKHPNVHLSKLHEEPTWSS